MIEACVVVSDLHGSADKLQLVVDYYKGDGVRIVLAGDTINKGPQSRETLDLVQKIGATLLLGNNDYVPLAAMTATDSEQRKAWQEIWLPHSKNKYELNLLSSYSLRRLSDREQTAENLKLAMSKLGHLALLQQASIFYDHEHFVATHCGATRLSWQSQLDCYQQLDFKISQKIFDEEPLELFDKEVAQATAGLVGLDKPLITGHAHSNLPVEERMHYNSKGELARVHLAQTLTPRSGILAYQSWDKRVVHIN